jgi:hypothetical protein
MKSILLPCLLVLLPVTACSTGASPTPAVSASGAAASPAPVVDAAQKAPRAAVDAITVLELKQCCACTSKRQQDARAVLDAELAKRSVKPKVTVVYMDAEAEKALEYKAMREPMVTPALYFLDASGEMVSFLQGELTAEQIAEALGSK